MRKHVFAILLEAIFVAGGIIVKELTDLSTIAAASAVIVASLIAMAILYYPEIKAFTNRSWGGAINRIKISEETMTNILGPIAILFLFGLDGLVLQIPADRHRYHYIKAKVTVCRHMDGTLSLFHGPRRLARYDENGQVIADELPTAA